MIAPDNQSIVPLDDGLVRATTSGRVRGALDSKVDAYRFLGIPYAAPPIGPHRFRPAHPLGAWQGVLDATRFGPAFAQLFDPAESLLEELVDEPGADDPIWVGSEDALRLNIWSPKRSVPDGWPVLVYIHGGANWLEASRCGVYHGDVLCSEGAVVVTLNYRLGVFGFLDLSCLGPEAPQAAASNGLTDQLMALDWIIANIAAFGGNPNQITLLGESAGSMDISWLLASGRLAGKVKRVVLMSGIASVVGFGRAEGKSLHTLDEGKHRAQLLLGAMGINSFTQLNAMSCDEIMVAQANAFANQDTLFNRDTLFYPRLEGMLGRDPFDAANLGLTRDIEILAGFTSYEMGLWLLWDEELDRRDTLWAAQQVPGLPSHLHGSLAQHYDMAFAHEDKGVRAMHLLGDAMFVMPTLIFAQAHARNGGKVWLYQFDYPSIDPRTRALHAADQVFFFGKANSPGGVALMGAPMDAHEAKAREELSLHMQAYLHGFAKGYDLSNKSWPSFTPQLPKAMNFAHAPKVQPDLFGARWSWWLNHVVSQELDWSTL